MNRRFKMPVSDGSVLPLINGNHNKCRLTRMKDTYKLQPTLGHPQIHNRDSHSLTTQCRAPRIGTILKVSTTDSLVIYDLKFMICSPESRWYKTVGSVGLQGDRVHRGARRAAFRPG